MARRTIDYGDIMGDSISMMKKHVIIFLPNVMLVLLSLLLFTIFFHLSGLAEAFIRRPYIIDDPSALRAVFSSLSTTPRFILSLVGLIALELLLGAYFTVMKFGMIRDVLKNDKTSLKSASTFAEKNYLNFITVYLAVKAIIFLPLFALLFIFLMAVRATGGVPFVHFLMGLFGVVWFFYAIVMTVRLFFVYPVMTFERERFFNVIGHEFHYVKTHITHTLLSFLIVIVVLFAYAFIRESVNILGLQIQAYAVVIFLVIMLLALEVFVTTWEHVFIFKSYADGKKIDRILKESGHKSSKKSAKKSKKGPAKKRKTTA